jgi:hypothetical protein
VLRPRPPPAHLAADEARGWGDALRRPAIADRADQAADGGGLSGHSA